MKIIVALCILRYRSSIGLVFYVMVYRLKSRRQEESRHGQEVASRGGRKGIHPQARGGWGLGLILYQFFPLSHESNILVHDYPMNLVKCEIRMISCWWLRNPANHLGCIKHYKNPCKWWGKLPTSNWWVYRISGCHQQYPKCWSWSLPNASNAGDLLIGSDGSWFKGMV